MPPDPDPKAVPWWAAFEDYAERLRMTIPELLAWCEYGEGEWWLSRLKLKWQIQAAADEARYGKPDGGAKSDAAWAAEGWRGGQCDPTEFAIFADEGAA